MSTSTFTDEEFFDSEHELLDIFGLDELGAPRVDDTFVTAANSERIEKIVIEALHEAVVRDTATFFFKTFGVGLSGFASAVFSSFGDLANDLPDELGGELNEPRSEIDLGGSPLDGG